MLGSLPASTLTSSTATTPSRIAIMEIWSRFAESIDSPVAGAPRAFHTLQPESLETGERMVSPTRSRQRSNSWTMNGPLTMAKTISETTSALMKSPR